MCLTKKIPIINLYLYNNNNLLISVLPITIKEKTVFLQTADYLHITAIYL